MKKYNLKINICYNNYNIYEKNDTREVIKILKNDELNGSLCGNKPFIKIYPENVSC